MIGERHEKRGGGWGGEKNGAIRGGEDMRVGEKERGKRVERYK